MEPSGWAAVDRVSCLRPTRGIANFEKQQEQPHEQIDLTRSVSFARFERSFARPTSDYRSLPDPASDRLDATENLESIIQPRRLMPGERQVKNKHVLALARCEGGEVVEGGNLAGEPSGYARTIGDVKGCWETKDNPSRSKRPNIAGIRNGLGSHGNFLRGSFRSSRANGSKGPVSQ